MEGVGADINIRGKFDGREVGDALTVSALSKARPRRRGMDPVHC